MTSTMEKLDSKKVVRNLMPSFIFSTTRDWNPGDDFILYGVRNLLESIIPEFNSFIYDRNPDYHALRIPSLSVFDTSGKKFPVDFTKVPDMLPALRNSLGLKGDLSNIDFAIFAGSPEWAGFMLEPFNKFILENKIPSIYLGVGFFEGFKEHGYKATTELDRKSFQNSLLITARDQLAGDMLSPHVENYVLSCPALFSSKVAKKRTQKKKIALSTQGTQGRNSISQENFDYSIKLFKKLISLFDCEIVCHYKGDYKELSPIFGSQVKIHYCYDPKDYFDIYDNFDLTVTTRVHGAGICASMGIPGVCLSHTSRIETTKGFLSEMIDPHTLSVEEGIKLIQNLDVPKRSEEIISLKSQMFQEYQNLLRPIFKNLGFI
jgi:hypothetical protein